MTAKTAKTVERMVFGSSPFHPTKKTGGERTPHLFLKLLARLAAGGGSSSLKSCSRCLWQSPEKDDDRAFFECKIAPMRWLQSVVNEECVLHANPIL